MTTLSKSLAMLLFVLLPFIGFYFGYIYPKPTVTQIPTVTNAPSPTTKPSPTVDETSLLKSTIKQALVAKHGNSANELTVSVSKIIGDFSSGGASGSGGGGMWFAAKVDGKWQLVWDGNGIILCTDLTAYPDFPASMIPECYNDKTSNLVKR